MKQIHNQADVKNWLIRANDDLLFAEASIDTGFYPQVCFICQQAAEKALKGFIYSLQENFTPKELKDLRIHNLGDLIQEANARGGHLTPDVIDACKTLSLYYVSTRYPDIPDPIGTYTKEIAQDAKQKARRVTDFIKEQLGFS